jgi:hypothetical protein
LVVFAWTAGCVSTSDPLKDWTFRPFPGWEEPPYGHNTNHLDKAIIDDYQDFIAKNKLEIWSPITGFFEDGTGQHAVKIETYKNHTSWYYILIYNKENKRINVIKRFHVRHDTFM